MNGEDANQPGMRDMMALMRADNGIVQMMHQPAYKKRPEDPEPTVSQADVIADLFNVMRLDVKAIADEVGADISIQQMSPDYAAVLMQQLIRRESLELIQKFNELEDQRERVLSQLADEETLEDHRWQKQRIVHSQPDPESPVPPSQVDDTEDEDDAEDEDEEPEDDETQDTEDEDEDQSD